MGWESWHLREAEGEREHDLGFSVDGHLEGPDDEDGEGDYEELGCDVECGDQSPSEELESV